ncbi:MAG: MarR family transcriptional regulator [Deltaproteobacteria bacterium]|jgi:predicted transcriptional regulator|nr:MarR family transcriptional regulator [Deltaproteobacteria bacterium]
MDNNKDKILEIMKKSGKPLKKSEITEMSSLDKKDVNKLINKLKKEEAIVSPKRCYWEPK